jgi:hypothetical protein
LHSGEKPHSIMASAPNRTSYADYDNDDLVDRRSFRGSPGNTPLDFSGGGSGRGLSGRGESVSHHSDLEQARFRAGNTPLDFSGGGSGRGLSGRGESVSHHSDLEQSRFQEAPSGNYPLESDTFDQDGEHEDSEYDPDEWEIPVYPMREYVMHLCCFEKPLRFNPVVSAIGVAVLWGFSLWCIIDPEGSLSQLLLLRAHSTEYFTWFYIVTRPLFLFFVIWLTYRYGHIRMGEADSVPEYSNTTYVAMMFSAGVATGLFYFAVSEPLWHENSHWFAKAGYHPQGKKVHHIAFIFKILPSEPHVPFAACLTNGRRNRHVCNQLDVNALGHFGVVRLLGRDRCNGIGHIPILPSDDLSIVLLPHYWRICLGVDWGCTGWIHPRNDSFWSLHKVCVFVRG